MAEHVYDLCWQQPTARLDELRDVSDNTLRVVSTGEATTSSEVTFDPEERIRQLIDTTIEPTVYTDTLHFELAPSAFIGKGVVEASPETRFRAATRALRNHYPESIPLKKNERTPLQALKNIEQYLASNISIQGKKLSRGILVPQELLFTHLEKRFDELNHPVSQLLNQIETEFVESDNSEVLTSGEIKGLKRDILLVTHRAGIKSAVATFCNELKKVAEMNTSSSEY